MIILNPKDIPRFREEIKTVKGVSLEKDRGRRYVLRSKITVDGFSVHIGYFPSVKKAALAYDIYVVTHKLDRKTNYLKKKVD